MRLLLQRVSQASVTVDAQTIAQIGAGLLIFAGIELNDTEQDLELAARKTISLRIFADEQNAMNRSIVDVRGEILLVSQFTLFANLRKGNRPSFSEAAGSALASQFIDRFHHLLQQMAGTKVQVGRFGAHMEVALENNGPVTIWLDTKDLRPVLSRDVRP